jgi:hypothetical protein
MNEVKLSTLIVPLFLGIAACNKPVRTAGGNGEPSRRIQPALDASTSSTGIDAATDFDAGMAMLPDTGPPPPTCENSVSSVATVLASGEELASPVARFVRNDSAGDMDVVFGSVDVSSMDSVRTGRASIVRYAVDGTLREGPVLLTTLENNNFWMRIETNDVETMVVFMVPYDDTTNRAVLGGILDLELRSDGMALRASDISNGSWPVSAKYPMVYLGNNSFVIAWEDWRMQEPRVSGQNYMSYGLYGSEYTAAGRSSGVGKDKQFMQDMYFRGSNSARRRMSYGLGAPNRMVFATSSNSVNYIGITEIGRTTSRHIAQTESRAHFISYLNGSTEYVAWRSDVASSDANAVYFARAEENATVYSPAHSNGRDEQVGGSRVFDTSMGPVVVWARYSTDEASGPLISSIEWLMADQPTMTPKSFSVQLGGEFVDIEDVRVLSDRVELLLLRSENGNATADIVSICL